MFQAMKNGGTVIYTKPLHNKPQRNAQLITLHLPLSQFGLPL